MSVTVAWRGVHESATLAANRTAYPAATTAGPFYLGPSDPSTAFARMRTLLEPAWEAGMLPLWTFKPDPPAVAAGAWDLTLKTMRDYHLANGRQSIAYPFHEPEDNMDASTFVPMFTRCYALLSCPPAVWCGYVANTFQWQTGYPRTADPTAWRVPATDFWGADVYSGTAFPADATLATHAGFQRWWTTCAQGAPFVIPERGFAGPSRPDVMAREAAFLADPATPVQGYQLWNALDKGLPSWLFDRVTSLVASGLLSSLAAKGPIPA